MKLKHLCIHNASVNSALMRRAAVCFMVSAFMGGCASVGMNTSPEEVVHKRAQQKLDALLEWDIDTAYALTSPGYREIKGKHQFTSRYLGASGWQAAKVQSVTCDDEYTRCKVSYLVTYTDRKLPAPVKTSLNETWIYVQDQWYLYLR
ncbi:hypothetical protein [Marinobacterium marinum]|uniref:DUF4440 domain-containing protein n=1 Tax=Marinobacterium marinum TaxID=2756129 RepID=A0A7W1WVM0_9GAMM|nr:hypothetical protein [Marinobacterium marinum]MBA4501002.1 hypothetical protein [Marinobacterium marinum]